MFKTLQVGDVIETGDEFFEHVAWHKFSSSIGNSVNEAWMRYTPRRRIPSLTKENVLECVRMLMILQDDTESSFEEREYAIATLNKYIWGK